MAKFSNTGEAFRSPTLRVSSGPPGREQKYFSGIVNALKYVIVNQTFNLHIETEMTGYQICMC